MKNSFIAIIAALALSLVLMLSPLFAPSGMGVIFLYYIACAAGAWLFLVAISFVPQKKGLKRLAAFCRRALFLLTAVFLVVFSACELYVFSGRAPEYSGGYDAVIILGAGLHGERPSATLYSRLHAGRAALISNPGSLAVLSGGQGPGEYITEAEAMRRYLEDYDIGKDRVRLEENSTNTIENLTFSKSMLDAELGASDYRVLVVTNDFHIARSLYIAEQIGLRADGMAAPTPDISAMKLASYLREGFAMMTTILQVGLS